MINKYTFLVVITASAIMPVIVSAQNIPPTTGDSASSAGTIAPSTDASASSAAPAVPSTGSSASSAGPAAITPAVTPPSGGSSSSSGGSRRSVFFVQNTPNSATKSSVCPLITSYMKSGGDNNSSEVRNLQLFLRNTQEVDVDVNGIYDSKTENAVKTFQTRYANDILAPWGATAPSGMVSITTSKKLNELACKTPLTLNQYELATINSYKQGQVLGSSSGTDERLDLSNQNIIGTATSGPELGTNVEQGANTAAIVNTSIFNRFWNFLKSLF